MFVMFITDDLAQGGAERQMAMLADGLAGKGNRVMFVQFYDHPVAYEDILKRRDIKVMTVPQGRRALPRVSVIKNLVERYRPDVVVSFKDGSSMACCLARKLTDFRLVVLERNSVIRQTLRDRLKYRLFGVADAVVCNSHTHTQWIKEQYSELVPLLHTVVNGIDADSFYCDGSNTRGHMKRVLTVARLVPQKNVETYIRVCARLLETFPNVDFYWIGRYEDEKYYRKIKDKLLELLLLANFFYLPEVEDLKYCYSIATHFCLPSLYEGHSNALSEAMAAQLPCCCSDAGDNRLILGDYTRVFDPEDEEDMVEKMTDFLLIDRAERAAEGRRNYNRIKKRYPVQTCLESYISIFEKVCSSG